MTDRRTQTDRETQDRLDRPDRPDADRQAAADAPTADRLRAEIDAGKTGDKKAHPDPAASPLGTDAEAGGVPPRSVGVESAYLHEVDERPDSPKASPGHPMTGANPRDPAARSGTTQKAIGIAVAIAVILLLIWIF